MKNLYKENTTLKELYAKTQKSRTVAISYLENSRTDSFHLIANTYTNFERLEWIEKEYKREIYIMGILTDPEKRKKFAAKKISLSKYTVNGDLQSVNENNIQNFINNILNNEQYTLIYNEYLRTKDLLYLENIFNQRPIKKDINEQKRYLYNLVNDNEISSNLVYYTKDIMNDLILKEIDNIKTSLPAKCEQSENNSIKLKWTGEQIEIVTFFYDLLEAKIIEATKADINRIIANSFVDKSGNSFSISYIEKILKPQTSKSKNRIDLSPFL